MTDADLAPIVALLQNPGVARWWGFYDLERAKSEFLGDQTVQVFAIETAGRLIGLIDFYEELDPYYRHASLDIAIGDDFQRQGLGGDAMLTLIDHLIHRRGHHRLTIDPAAENLGAVEFYEKLGFRRVGVMRCYERGNDGGWHDGLLMELVVCTTSEGIEAG